MQKTRADYDDLEDAVLAIENEKADWARRMENLGRMHMDESTKRQRLEQQMYDSQVELAEYRNTALQAERDLAKAAGEIKARDSEIALLRSRENKTVVEHYHVLESAKKFTDNQLAEQIKENSRLNTMLKSMETHRNRVIADLEDMTRQFERLRSSKSREARSARASLSAEEKDVEEVLEDERRQRQVAEARVASLEKDLQDQRRQMSTANLSPSRASIGSAEARIARQQEEIARLEEAYRAALQENQQLMSELAQAQQASKRQATNENAHISRAELLRGLQQSHDALGRDMSDQLRKLDTTPLTPSRKHNTAFAHPNGYPSPSDAQAGKRLRTLEKEIDGLRQQLEDEREEKEFLYDRVKELQDGKGKPGLPGKPFPFEQAMYSHFRLKAKSLRSQLDQ